MGFTDELWKSCSTAAAVGLISHILYWRRGLHDPHAFSIILSHFTTYVALTTGFALSGGPVNGILSATAVSASYLTALFTSMLIYRLFFHPLRHFPGPFAAKVSKLYGPWVARKGKMHIEHFDLLKKYGDFVRSGPNELLLLRTDAIEKVHGARSKCTKRGTRADHFHYHGVHNLDSITNREEHRSRRQIWEKAFSNKPLESYEVYTRETIQTWFQVIEAAEGKPVNFSTYAHLIPLENICKVGYSKRFDFLKTATDLGLVDQIEAYFKMVAKLGHLDWPLGVSKALGLGKDQNAFDRTAELFVDEREKAGGPETEDILGFFLDDYHSAQPKAFVDHQAVYSDAQVIMVGGVPTVFATLANSFLYLIMHPDIRAKLRESLKPAFGKTLDGQFVDRDLAGIEYLDAFINETMRMSPVGGSNAPRTTPPEGIMVDDIFIPGNVKVFTPTYSFSLSDKFFKQPNEFIPERWTTRPDLIIDRKAFFPFFLGPFNCVGKRYALMFVRMVLSYTIWHYDFSLADGDGHTVKNSSKNQLVVKPGQMDLIFSEIKD